MKSTFIKVTDSLDKGRDLKRCVDGSASGRVFVVGAGEFRVIPGSPFAYWFRPRLRRLFSELDPFESGNRSARVGLQTSDNERFCRAWWEVPPSSSGWRPFSNGGSATPFYRSLDLVVNWALDGREIKHFRDLSSGRLRSRPQNESFYGRRGLTWPLRAARFCPQALETGSVISVRGYGAFAAEDQIASLWGILSSSAFDGLFKASLGRASYPEFVVGTLARVPVPMASDDRAASLAGLVGSGWSLRRSLDTVSEVSHAFVAPAVLQVSGGSFADRVSGWAGRVAGVEADLARVQSEIDELCFELYGISEEDRQAIAEGFGVNDVSVDGLGDDESSEEDDEADESAVELDPVGLAAGLVSWAVGVAVGRFDVRLVTGEREWSAEPDPFDPLPVCSPAMLTGDDGLPLQSPPARYPLLMSPVLVDDPGHELHLGARVRAVFDVVFGDDADRWWTEVGAVLDPKAADLEAWLRKSYFGWVVGAHGATSRIAPIMWPLGTRSGSYRVWLYAHRVTSDSVFRVLNDVVGPKLYVEERRLTDLRQEAGPSPSASQRKAIDTQETFVAELREFRDELVAVAPLWAPDLNDGVVIVLAPLWRLFAHHRGWSSELRDRWRRLAAGDYDWAQLAMRLWPERVVPKCAEDRSLAIAHGLEDVFWVADNDNSDKWQPRTVPTTPVEELIAARTNPTTSTARQHPTP